MRSRSIWTLQSFHYRLVAALVLESNFIIFWSSLMLLQNSAAYGMSSTSKELLMQFSKFIYVTISILNERNFKSNILDTPCCRPNVTRIKEFYLPCEILNTKAIACLRNMLPLFHDVVTRLYFLFIFLFLNSPFHCM